MKKILEYSKWVVYVAIIFFALTGIRAVCHWPGYLKYFWWDKTFEELLKPMPIVKEGDIAPDFTLKDLKGNELTFSKLRGKPVLLVFWGRH
jgi:cytochrome oxidase Cu insertion factor (SCO1/SenC/PrrC family)